MYLNDTTLIVGATALFVFLIIYRTIRGLIPFGKSNNKGFSLSTFILFVLGVYLFFKITDYTSIPKDTPKRQQPNTPKKEDKEPNQDATLKVFLDEESNVNIKPDKKNPRTPSEPKFIPAPPKEDTSSDALNDHFDHSDRTSPKYYYSVSKQDVLPQASSTQQEEHYYIQLASVREINSLAIQNMYGELLEFTDCYIGSVRNESDAFKILLGPFNSKAHADAFKHQHQDLLEGKFSRHIDDFTAGISPLNDWLRVKNP